MSDDPAMQVALDVCEGLVGGRRYDADAVGIGRYDDKPAVIVPTAHGVAILAVIHVGEDYPEGHMDATALTQKMAEAALRQACEESERP